MVASPPSLDPPIVLYDGLCGFCDASIRWLLAHDPEGRLRFAPLQGDTARGLRFLHPEIPAEIETLVLVDSGEVRQRSDAVLGALAYLPGWYARLRWVRWLPRPLRDVGYRIVARLRFGIWGRLETCRVPTPEQRSRFLP